MFSEIRQSAAGALEKAKIAFQQQRSSSSLSNDQTEQQQEEQRHLPTSTNITEEDTTMNETNNNNTNETSSNNMNNAWKDFRSSSTKALENAKLALIRNHSSLSNTDNNDDNNSYSSKNVPVPATDSQQTSTSSIDRLEELSQYCPKFTIQQRLIGFAMSFSLGYLIAFFSFRFFIKLIEGNPLPFALNYTFGHTLQLLASMFLCGPKRQFKNMFDETRRQTSMVYLSCLVINLIFVFIPLPSNKLRLLLLIITMMIQFCASCWYTLSYIPYGRKAAIRIMKKVIGIEDNNTSSDTTTNPYIGLQLGIQLPTFGGTMA